MQFPFKSPVAVVSGVVVLALTCIAMWWVLGDEKNVLFDQLTASQLNSISAELDRAGIAYSIDREKSAIVVSDSEAKQARTAAMSAGGSLHESTGFELFDKSDFGMTDFAQKINYQRAMEGEIARTVSALAGVKFARVHLVLPEHGLFRNEKQKPRASITLFLNEDSEAGADQIRSVQRIAASAVPDLSEHDVTVINQNGVTLSPASDSGERSTSSPARLAQKKAVENYMADKIRRVLEKAVGANRFAVSVDVILDLNQKTTTTEKVIDSGGDSGIKRIKASSSRNKNNEGGEDSSKEVEYALGHQSEQIVHSSGDIKHIQVGVVIDNGVESVDMTKLRELIAATAGIESGRGDGVTVVQNSIAAQNTSQPWRASGELVRAQSTETESSAPPVTWLLAAFVVGLSISGLALGSLRTRKRHLARSAEVQHLRQQLQAWISEDALRVDHR